MDNVTITNPLVLQSITRSKNMHRGASPAAKNEVQTPIDPVRQFSQTLPKHGISKIACGGGSLVRKFHGSSKNGYYDD